MIRNDNDSSPSAGATAPDAPPSDRPTPRASSPPRRSRCRPGGRCPSCVCRSARWCSPTGSCACASSPRRTPCATTCCSSPTWPRPASGAAGPTRTSPCPTPSPAPPPPGAQPPCRPSAGRAIRSGAPASAPARPGAGAAARRRGAPAVERVAAAPTTGSRTKPTGSSGASLGLDLATAPLIAAGLQVYWTQLALGPPTRTANASSATPTPPPCAPAAAARRRLRSPASAPTMPASATCTARCAAAVAHVRVKCAHCESTKGIHYEALAPAHEGVDPPPPARVPAAVKAECCDDLRPLPEAGVDGEGPVVEPVADDLASVALDLLVADAGFERQWHNLMLLFGDAEATGDGGAPDGGARGSVVHGSKARPQDLPVGRQAAARCPACRALLDEHGHTLVAGEARALLDGLRTPRPGRRARHAEVAARCAGRRAGRARRRRGSRRACGRCSTSPAP